MPKEQITFPKEQVDVPVIVSGLGEDSPEPLYHGEPVISVHWSPEGAGEHVQMGVEMNTQWIKQLADVAAKHGDLTVTVYTDVLERSVLNRAIRMLRRARDKAYGVDA